MNFRNQNVVWGVVLALVGVFLALMIHLHPEELKVPAFVAHAAASVFVFAGAGMILREAGRARLYAWLVVAMIAAMLTPALWIAFGPGERACVASFGASTQAVSGLLCRATFGFGTAISAIILALVIRAACKMKNAE